MIPLDIHDCSSVEHPSSDFPNNSIDLLNDGSSLEYH
jgi:hypothetical protein